eukprot:TRINITY_DN25783_c0_g1_i2.p1 TRINITY_DN25783_c0_g1~~TRINITY_DN25783_c0_g1_i2.p1  ORF type:complete len:874 (-),score=138.16 TRINITY_DN25783_c0_g1_i2:185-2722(-)
MALVQYKGGGDADQRKRLALPNGKSPAGDFNRIARVTGRVISAKGLPNRDTFSLSDPYCIIKAVRANNSCVNIYMTNCVMNTISPVWQEDFDFTVPEEWGIFEMVGVRALVFDADGPYRSFIGSEDFLGGCDIDVSAQKTGRIVSLELDLGGIAYSKSQKSRKPRLDIVLTVYREIIPLPPQLNIQLQTSMQVFEYVREITGVVLKATDLPNMDLRGHSDPVCIVRVLTMSGDLVEVHRTQTQIDTGNPHWSEEFSMTFDVLDQPLLAIFDVFDEDDPDGLVEKTGEHMGSAVVPLLACLAPAPRRRKLLLQGETQRHETRHTAYGVPLLEAVRKGGASQRPDVSGKATSIRVQESSGDENQRIKEKQKKKQEKYTKLLRHSSAKDFEIQETKLTEVLARIGKGWRNLIYGAIEQPGRPILHVELRTRTKKHAMPFADLFEHPVSVGDAIDVEDVLADPGWDSTLYDHPKELVDEEKCPPYRGLMVGKDHITFIYGVVHGAMALPKPDGPDGNKVDAYCLIQALTVSGEKAFIHRTRVIKNTQNPNWEEAFYFPVPNDFFVSRLQLSVYTQPVDVKSILVAGAAQTTVSVLDLFSSRSKTEQDQIGLDDMIETSRDDILLGRASLDLAYALPGAMLEQEVQLMGDGVREQDKLSSGFRRTRSISFECVVERRYKPCFEKEESEDMGVMNRFRRQHQLTRQPDPRRPFEDFAITPMQGIPDAEEVAPQALELASTSSLVSTQKRRPPHNYTKIPDSNKSDNLIAQERWDWERREEINDEKREQARQEKKQNMRLLLRTGDQYLAPGADFTTRKPMLKISSSLPALATNFGRGAGSMVQCIVRRCRG